MRYVGRVEPRLGSVNLVPLRQLLDRLPLMVRGDELDDSIWTLLLPGTPRTSGSSRRGSRSHIRNRGCSPERFEQEVQKLPPFKFKPLVRRHFVMILEPLWLVGLNPASQCARAVVVGEKSINCDCSAGKHRT